MYFYENEFCTIEIEQENYTANVKWTEKTVNMTEEQFKEEQLAQLSATLKYNLKTFFIDGRLQQFAITPKLQDWVAINAIKPSVDNGLLKTAILLPEDIFSQISVEQTMEEGNASEFQVSYFNDEKKAKEWLLE